MIEDNSTLEYLVRHLILAKKQEDTIKCTRIALEEKIAALVPGPERGQITVSVTENVKITVERGFNYKADCQAIANIFRDLPDAHVPIKHKTTHELDVAGYEWYRENDSATAELLSKCITVTPKKTSVSVKATK